MKTITIEENLDTLTSKQQQQFTNPNEQLSDFDIGDLVYVYMPDLYPCWKDSIILDFEPEINSFKILYIDADDAGYSGDRGNFRLNMAKLEPIVTIVQANSISKNLGEIIAKADNDKQHLRDNYKKYAVENGELINIFGSMSRCLEYYADLKDGI